MSENLLEVSGLRTHFFTDSGTVKAVDGVDFRLRANETLGMVGESGCGKSVTSLSIMRLIASPGRIVEGRILFRGEDLLKKSPREMRAIRGNKISMIFQEPMTSLNPVHTIGDQIAEAVIQHQRMDKKEAMRKAEQMLELVGIPSPAQRVREHPHQLSGGMRQRVMIAMALSCNPSLLIADEPTTALDVTIQAQILQLMRSLKGEMGASLMIITHDLGVIAEMADNVVVLYAGKVVEYADVHRLFSEPLHPYAMELLESIPRITDEPGRKLYPIEGSIPDLLKLPTGCSFHPRCRFAVAHCRLQEPPLEFQPDGRQVRCWMYHVERSSLFPSTGEGRERRVADEPSAAPPEPRGQRPGAILEVKGLVKHFPITGGVFRRVVGRVKAVDGVSFTIRKGETLGMVGESGCGKTTTGRLLLRLLEPTSGEVVFEGRNLLSLSRQEMREQRRDMQIIFQDPFASLNPRMTVGDIVAEAFIIHGEKGGRALRDRAVQLLQTVGLQPDHARRYPHQFSGGQRQRIGIARAIGLNPRLIICDEPVSALDVSIQAQIINLLEDLQDRLGLTYLFIAHNLSVVKHIADRVAVMYLGRIVEMSDTLNVFDRPQHPYTEALLSAVPVPDPRLERRRIVLQGDVPSPSNPPPGCHFHTRCPYVFDRCTVEAPVLLDVGGDHLVACHLRTAAG